MTKSQSASYKEAFKATSVFGGVQVFNIVIALVKSKVIAVLLGPSGMGLVTLFTSTTGLISGVTNFGLGTSAVKNVAAAAGSGNEEKLAVTVAVFRRLVWITGALGFVLTLSLAPWLSELVFGNKTYTVAFALLSLTLLFTQISAGQTVILQGMRKIQYMARASMLGALIGLLTSMPLYYFFQEDGIVPAIIITSVTTLALSWKYASKVRIPIALVDYSDFKAEGKEMLRMGFLISMSNLITIGTTYFVRIFISHSGGIADVGLYTAGFGIVGTYVGMVFTAMSTDYYPRLAAVAHDNSKCKQTINQQAEIAILILAPILTFFIVFIHWGIVLLYSEEFLGIVRMLHWATLGVFFKALSWPIAFVFLAKSASKVYFWNELVTNLYMLVLNVLSYTYFGLTGLGISFLISYALYFIQVYVLSRSMYHFSLSKGVLHIFLIQGSIAATCFLVVYFFAGVIAYSVGIVLITIATLYSWQELNKRIGLRQVIMKYLKR